MPFMRHTGMLKALFELVVEAWNGFFIVLLIYVIGCQDLMSIVRDLGRMGS